MTAGARTTGAVRALACTMIPLGLLATPLSAQGTMATQDPTSAQPTLPKAMPELTIPVSGAGDISSAPRKTPRHVARKMPTHLRTARSRRMMPPIDRPALANVELLEPLPHPPQPPHVVVPVPAYPFENFITYFTVPPPPVVCRPTRADRFKPNLELANEKPVLCTADNP